MTDMLKLRADMKKRRPSFARSEGSSKNTRKTKDAWRKPKGRDNKLRRRVNGEGVVSKGYSVPNAVRGLHACGLKDIIIENSTQLINLNPKTDAARISATVGTKKKIVLVAEAKKLKIKILNPLYKKKIKKEKKEKPKKAPKKSDDTKKAYDAVKEKEIIKKPAEKKKAPTKPTVKKEATKKVSK
ncbi:MAG: 50S ribosomal protein L32e [Candidatus Aenigmarchaeota archaeon]|nr:50S ribosomal protein L32e [Candidatus Aenigmarchaeota archaeon]